jgi:hypothetical protein
MRKSSFASSSVPLTEEMMRVMLKAASFAAPCWIGMFSAVHQWWRRTFPCPVKLILRLCFMPCWKQVTPLLCPDAESRRT